MAWYSNLKLYASIKFVYVLLNTHDIETLNTSDKVLQSCNVEFVCHIGIAKMWRQ